MAKEFGKLRHILVLLEILLGKEVAEGVGVHLAPGYAQMAAPALQSFRETFVGHGTILAVAEMSRPARLLHILPHLLLKAFLKKHLAELAALALQNHLAIGYILPQELHELMQAKACSGKDPQPVVRVPVGFLLQISQQRLILLLRRYIVCREPALSFHPFHGKVRGY